MYISNDKLLTVRQVLQAHPFRGINRKVQLKPVAWALRGGVEVPTEALFINYVLNKC